MLRIDDDSGLIFGLGSAVEGAAIARCFLQAFSVSFAVKNCRERVSSTQNKSKFVPKSRMSSVTATNNSPTWIIDAPQDGTGDLKLLLAEARVFVELSRSKSKLLKEQQSKVVAACMAVINEHWPSEASAALDDFKTSEPSAASSSLRKLLVSLNSSKTAISRSQSRDIFDIVKVIDLPRLSPTIRRRRQTVPPRPKSDIGKPGTDVNSSGSMYIADGNSTRSSKASFLSVEGFSALFTKRASSYRLTSPVTPVASRSHGRSSLTTAVAAKPESAQNLALALFGDANMPIADEHPGSYREHVDVVKAHKAIVHLVAEFAGDGAEIHLKKQSASANIAIFKLYVASWISDGALRITDCRRLDSERVLTMHRVKTNVYSLACGNAEISEPQGFVFVVPDQIDVFVGENASPEDKPLVAVVRNNRDGSLDVRSRGDSVGTITVDSEYRRILKLDERIYDDIQSAGESLFVFAGVSCALAEECTK
ncbi:hypothetical protein HDU82_008875 [Entophlyctis luteolus]|nr:hypothetical protein HDU82_008875 [Entophlyctis luteolus]